MKTRAVIFFLFTLILSCSSSDELNGYWTVKSNFYKATYLIGEFNEQKGVLIVSYNDGSTVYTNKTRPNQFVFKNLIKKDETYVDAISGATTTASDDSLNHIRHIHSDTIEVTTFLFGKPLKELWIRTTKTI